VLRSDYLDDSGGRDLRVAFDFDGVLADDASEKVNQSKGLDKFQEHEALNAGTAQDAGPLRDFLLGINHIQRLEEQRKLEDPGYDRRVFVSIVTARNAPAHERAIRSLKAWGVTVNDAFFLGGVDKSAILRVLRPHIFFDDQMGHLERAASVVTSVHIPFGIANEPRG
jgi:5'-nucleotidase